MIIPEHFNVELYFITTTVIDWIDIFTRPKYKHIIIQSLEYCQKNKGLKIYAWVLMSNHLHAIVSTDSEHSISDIFRDFKKYTSKQIISELMVDLEESRKIWILERFRLAGLYNNKIREYRVWQDGFFPEYIATQSFFRQKINYIHNNPVNQEIVSSPEDYMYSSAVDYAGGKGLLILSEL